MTKSLDTIKKRSARASLSAALGLDQPGLLDQPQPLAILPSRFWNRIDTWKHQLPFLGGGIALMSVVMVLLYPPLLAMIGVAANWVILPILLVATLLPLGLFERCRLVPAPVRKLPPRR
jgi:hypothetical protein